MFKNNEIIEDYGSRYSRVSKGKKFDEFFDKISSLIWRVMQIQKYLEQYPVNQYVVLDDLSLNIPNLVQTDPTIGLTQSDAQKAIEILKCYS
jgi:hypothetical protein